MKPNVKSSVLAVAVASLLLMSGGDSAAAQQPAIYLYPSSGFSFQAQLGRPLPQPQQLAVYNTGNAALNFTATTDQNWCYVNGQNSLGAGEVGSVNPGGSPTVLYVSVAQLVIAGTYDCTITVSDSSASNNPQTIPVKYTVVAPSTGGAQPTIALSPPARFHFEAQSGGATPMPLAQSLTNTGQDTLNYSYTTDQDWCRVNGVNRTGSGGGSLEPASTLPPGSRFALLYVSVDSPSNVGTFYCTVTLSDPNATNDPQTVLVEYAVIAPPGGGTCTPLTYSPAASGFSTNPTGPARSSLTVSANQRFYTFVDYGVSNIDSIQLPSSGSNSCVFDNAWLPGSNGQSTARFRCTASAAPGRYPYVTGLNSGTSSNTCASGPTTIGSVTVNAVVVQKPTISLFPSLFAFSAQTGGPTPDGQTLTVANAGNAILNFTATTNQDWCRLNGRNNTGNVPGSLVAGAATTLTVTVDAPSNRGTFSCTITVSDPNATNNPQTAFVSYTVTASTTGGQRPTISLSPGRFYFEAEVGGVAPLPLQLTVRNTGNATLNFSATTDQDWCRVNGVNRTGSFGDSLEPGTFRAILPVSVDGPSNVGTFTCTVTVSDPNATNNPQTVVIDYVVTTPSGGTPTKPTSVNAYNGGNDPLRPGSSAAQCGEIRLVWVDSSSNEDGFRIYRDGLLVGTVGPNIETFTYAPGDAASHRYAVSAFTNVGGESVRVNAANNPLSAVRCGANLTTSDKDIVSVNGVVNRTNDCLNNAEFPSRVRFELGDTIGFAINLCNTAPASFGNAATSILIDETLVNLARVDKTKPATDPAAWNATVTDGLSISSISVVSGTEPANLKLSIAVTGSIAPASSAKLRFFAKTAFPQNFVGTASRFQNCASISYVKDGVSRSTAPVKCTPMLLFDIDRAPTRQEVAP